MLGFALGVLAGSGLLAAVPWLGSRRSTAVGVIGAVAGIVLFAGWMLAAWSRCGFAAIDLGFPIPANNVRSALFLLPILVLGLAAALFSPAYLAAHGRVRAGSYWLFFNLLLGAMLCIPLARDVIAFLCAWEVMGVASFALVAYDFSDPAVKRAAWHYLLACQAGAMLLVFLFAATGAEVIAGSWGLIFLFALPGFGLKIGFPPLYGWLPEAHPAAPAPVSALMSGAMLNLGFYGLLTFGCVAPEYRMVYGWALLTLGLSGGLLGIIFALGQRNLKRLLAYSSIENMGLIAVGLGLGFLGDGIMAALGWSGAMLHLLNHAVLKGGLFLGAGAVANALHGELDIDRMGGLMKRMPWTGTIFSLNALGLAGLPPLNGFVGEFLIYMAAFAGIAGGGGAVWIASLATVVILALIGALAATVYVKAIGAVFLGLPRTPAAEQAKEAPRSLRLVPALLFGLNPLLLLLSPWLVQGFGALTAGWVAPEAAAYASGWCARLVPVLLLLLLLPSGLLIVRAFWSRRRPSETGVTWDCGFARPTARMEYTGSALTAPQLRFMRRVFAPEHEMDLPSEMFPKTGGFNFRIVDLPERLLWGPLFRGFGRLAEKVHKLQSGYLHFYILLMMLALLAMLVWGMFFHAPAAGGR